MVRRPLIFSSLLLLGLSMRATSLQIVSHARHSRNSARSKSSLSMVATTPRPSKTNVDSQIEKKNFMEQISAAGLASAAVVAAAAVNQAVGKTTS